MADLNEQVNDETCINQLDGEQRFAILNCAVGLTENGYNYSTNLVDLTDIAPVPTSAPDAFIDLTWNMPSKKEVSLDSPIVLDLNNTKKSSNVGVKTNECKKHKIPTTFSPDISEDCSPSKLPKVKLGEVYADFSNISSSTSTITSENHTLVNGSTCNMNNLPRQILDVKKCNENSPLDLPIYYQVLDMFPHIEYNYLMRLCSKKSDINEIINILLETSDYPREKTICTEASNVNPHLDRIGSDTDSNFVKDSNDLNNVDGFRDCLKSQTTEQSASPVSENTQLEFLIQILPDADRSFLESKSTLEENKLWEFIYEALESKNYPRIDVKSENPVEINNDYELGLYTTAFNIDNFLKIFPEPVQYFMDENRKCKSNTHAIEFLKRRYQYQNIKVIAQIYKKHKYNMSRACEALDKTHHTRATKRSLSEIRMPQETNLGFLQEACFVEHKAEITSYINSKAESKQREYEQAKKNSELIECGCCFEQCLFEDCAACNEGDLFCKTCIKKSAEVRIGDGLNTFPCLLACGAEFSLQLLQNLLDANIFSRLIKRIQLEEVRAAEIEGLEVCPFCEFATIPPPETSIFTCLNPECLKESCRKCHKVSHIPQRCEEVENDDQARARKYIEDEMTKALVRECYKCKKSFIKVDGCNKMTCTCGATMCYICRQPIKDYKHFNGPGANDTSKCPLYSTDKVLHVDAVTAVAKQALQSVSTNNPSLQLKHDPTKVLPTVTKSSLPPGVQENAAALVQRLNQRYRPHLIQARNNVEMVIDNVARNFNNNPNFIPIVGQLADTPHRPPQHANNEPNQWAAILHHYQNQSPVQEYVRGRVPDDLLHPDRADNYQALQQFDRVMENVRRRHEGNLPEHHHD